MAKNSKPLKILSLPVDRGGCGWYRVRQPFQMINENSTSNAHVIDKEADDPVEIARALCEADILVVRQGGEGGIDPIKGAADAYAQETKLKRGFHAKVVVDIDDNVELISPYSQHYENYGAKEFFDEGRKQWLWKDGESNFNLVQNRAKLLSFMLGLRRADLVTVTTEKLAEYARQFNDNVAVLPNAINKNSYWKPPFQPNKTLRVGWSGGISHYEDWYSIKDPLNALLRKYKFTLVMAGADFSGIIDKDLHQYVEIQPWFGFEAFPYRSMLMQLDIAIIPLADLPFNHYKSSIKLYEFSAMGVPSVTAGILPYSASGIKNTLYYADPASLVSNLEKLINDKDFRIQLGLDAQKEVFDNWTAQQHVKTYLDTYRAIL